MPDRRKKTVDIRELVLQMRKSDQDRVVQRATGMHRQTVKRYRAWAAEQGLLTAINPDAHETAELNYVRSGINAARKGWLTKENVLNTRSLAEVRKTLSGESRRESREQGADGEGRAED